MTGKSGATGAEAAVGDAGLAPVSGLGYTEASRELDSIVEFFEQREVDIDELVGKLHRATAIVEELDTRIRKTRVQVEELVPKLQAASRPLGDDEDDFADDLDEDDLEVLRVELDDER